MKYLTLEKVHHSHRRCSGSLRFFYKKIPTLTQLLYFISPHACNTSWYKHMCFCLQGLRLRTKKASGDVRTLRNTAVVALQGNACIMQAWYMRLHQLPAKMLQRVLAMRRVVNSAHFALYLADFNPVYLLNNWSGSNR